MVLDYSELQPPKIIKQEHNQEKYKYKEPHIISFLNYWKIN